ncbi:hypothetical protein [Pediococcus claussenii]|uniref:Exonuclease SbcC n=1 Tax=Pediococcus claussenii (strain ATCC BAA-344 / DSM 14800 / JCM 18046 / KCTC 3811 / LMG 21948 / P06) TaxID=701521 RepID=G8PDM0_PEDCP|nr:hypothetical protein [Pediococcus claussenii]AEV95355.1 hypothetical protein PECL_1091 [Pediococcus claussenii ATCC BAA-344]ANZ68887.1 hypothetical protein AYR57_00490 [Pediococcus claussenii]ANZ70703.1 hypothetical protein AYR58_00490 [Pediococcus claussenii]KRN18998.1 hypothetical protein IV79_GL001660 [Pediococcus claussenii]
MAEEQKVQDRDLLLQNLENKDNYIVDLAKAISEHDDLTVYQMLNPVRYRDEISPSFDLKYGDNPFDLVKDQRIELSAFLSENFIKYLIETFPFFYYREVSKGEFAVFLGNWWDRRLFGKLDVLNTDFIFDQTELAKLKQTFELAEDEKTYNIEKINALTTENDALQKIIDGREERDEKRKKLRAQQAELSEKGGLFESNKVKEDRENLQKQLSELASQDEGAKDAPRKITENEQKILELSKEDTILSYERNAVLLKFKNFGDFSNHVDSLYVDYMSSLIGNSGVKDSE